MSELIKQVTKMEFSKKLAIWILTVFAVFVFAGTGLMAFVNPDIGTAFVALVGVIMPIPLAAVYKYYTKAQAENVTRYGNTQTNTEVDLTDHTEIQEGDEQ